MAQLPEDMDPQDVTLAARRVLLDALEALGPHRSAAVLVGAQAVYLHAGAVELGVAAYTSDGDLGLDPAAVPAEPLIEEVMRAALFTREHPNRDAQPGIWYKHQTIKGRDVAIEVDLLIPTELAPGTRRGVHLPPHDRQATHRVAGLGLAMEDNAIRPIESLEPLLDTRTFKIAVAGVNALLVSKAYKLGERVNDPKQARRLVAKDASDVIGLMISSNAYDIAAAFERLLAVERVSSTTRQGLAYLRQLFGTPAAPGVTLAIRSLAGVKDPDEIEALAPAYMALMPE